MAIVHLFHAWRFGEHTPLAAITSGFFLLGILFAFLAGVGFEHPWLPVGLAAFGVFVGLVNMADVDSNKFPGR